MARGAVRLFASADSGRAESRVASAVAPAPEKCRTKRRDGGGHHPRARLPPMRSLQAMLSSRGPGCTVVELQDEALKAFEDGLLAKEAAIRLKLAHNVERIKEVERELVSFRRDMALTSGSKKLGASNIARRRLDPIASRAAPYTCTDSKQPHRTVGCSEFSSRLHLQAPNQRPRPTNDTNSSGTPAAAH